jgi:hypothetical protein
VGNKFSNVVFTDLFLSDVSRILPLTIKNAMYWDRNATQVGQPVYVKFEDVLIDTEWGLINYLRDTYRVKKDNLHSLVSMMQTKEKKSVFSHPGFKQDPFWGTEGSDLLKSLNPLDIIPKSPVHRPTFMYLQSLAAIDYPYIIVCQVHRSFLRHPITRYMEPETIIDMPDKPSRLKDMAFVSDQVQDSPKILYARPWNYKDFSKYKEKVMSF